MLPISQGKLYRDGHTPLPSLTHADEYPQQLNRAIKRSGQSCCHNHNHTSLAHYFSLQSIIHHTRPIFLFKHSINNMKLSLVITAASFVVNTADAASSSASNLRRRLSYEKVAGYKPDSQVRRMVISYIISYIGLSHI